MAEVAGVGILQSTVLAKLSDEVKKLALLAATGS